MRFFSNFFTIRWIMISILIAENIMKVFGIFHKLHGKQFCSQIKKMKKSQLFVLLNIILVRDWFRCSYFNELNIYAYSWCVQNFMKISRLNFEDEHFLPNHYFAKKNIRTVWKFKIIFFSTVVYRRVLFI